MKPVVTLMLAAAWLPVHAAEVLPAGLPGTWGTAESLYAGSTAQSMLQLEPDGLGVLAGSTPPAKRMDGQADDGKPPPALACTGPDGIPFRMRRLADTVDAEAAQTIAAIRAQTAQSLPEAVHTQAQLDAALASGQPTPLDALTPYGRRRFLRGLHWGERGLGGLNPAPLTRELTPAQLQAALHFVDSDSLLPMLSRDLAGAPLRLPPPSADVEGRLDQLEQFVQEDDDRRWNAPASATSLDRQAILQRYRALFGERMGAAALKRQPAGDLLPLFDAAALAADKNPDSPAFADLLLVHAELAARGIDTRRKLDDSLLYAMLAARRFEQARRFAATRPHLSHRNVPRLVDTLGPGVEGRSAFEYDAGTATLTRVAAPPAAGTELLVVVGAGCHFSADALEAIAGDAPLQARLRSAGLTLIVPPQSPIPLDYVASWNAAHPGLPIRIPAYAREWQAIEVQRTPAFYLLKDGKVAARREGWPQGGNRAALAELLDAAGR